MELIATNFPKSSLGGNVEYKKLGKSGLDVSGICIGTMGFGDLNRWGRRWLIGQDKANEVVKHALDLGVNWFDTANMYSLGASEEILGKALKKWSPNRDEIVIQTKVNQRMGLGPNRAGSSRKEILNEIDRSLQRLQLDYVDVYILHRWDWETPIEETMEAMNDVVKSGKARYIGASAMFAWQFEKAYMTAKMNGWTNFISMQNHLNLLYREDEREMLWACKDAGVVCTPYSPNASGYCCHPWGTKHNRSENDYKTAEKYAGTAALDEPVVKRLEEVAEKRGIPMVQVSLAWVRSKDPVFAPIVGITEPWHIDDALASLKVELTPEETKYLEEPYKPHPIVGALVKGQKYNAGGKKI
jgi:aryl-alcohol dehydrogenase-like predicted oxidoreductase